MRSTVLKTLLMTPVAVLAFSTHGNTWTGRGRLTVGKGTAAEEMGLPCEDEVSEKIALREWSLDVIQFFSPSPRLQMIHRLHYQCFVLRVWSYCSAPS